MALTQPSLYDTLPTFLQEALQAAALNQGFKKPRFTVRPGSSAGDNYFSDIYRAEVTDEEGDGRRLLAVVMKGMLQSAATREAIKLYRAFANEASFYTTILTAYADWLRESGLLAEGRCYPHAPRCFVSSVGKGPGADGAQDVLVLQDMRPEGFAMCRGGRHDVDLQHCRLVLGALADLHAASFAMERLQPQRFRCLRDSIQEAIREDADLIKMWDKDCITQRTLDMIKKRFPEGTAQYDKTKEFCNKARDAVREVLAPHNEGGNTINHGDCWRNNLLFKYSDDSTQPEGVCLLDFQFARYASPLLDVVYFLYTSTEKALRDAHLDALLRDYHARMQARMRALGLPDPDAVFSWQRLQSHFRHCGHLGMLFGILIVPLVTADPSDVPDLGSRLESGGCFGDVFEVKCGDPAERDRRVSDLVQEMVEREFI